MNPDHFISPPETTPLVYEDMTRMPLGIGTDPNWLDTPRFCTDAEASALSGVPERSLRTLQIGLVIAATQAPMRAGGFRRMWHLPEVATAAVTQHFKTLTGTDYLQTAKMLIHAAMWTKIAFYQYARSKSFRPEEFAADIVLADQRWLFLRTSEQVQLTTLADDLPLQAIGPIARLDDSGVSEGILPDNTLVRDLAIKALKASKTEVVVKLAAVFRKLESDGKLIRRDA